MRQFAKSAVARWLPVILWMVLIFVLSAQHHRPGPAPHPVAVSSVPGEAVGQTEDVFDIGGHLVLYAVLAACLWWALGQFGQLPARSRLALSLVGAVLYGATDEWHQSFVADRQASLFDLQVDASGALLAVVLIAIVVWAWARWKQPPTAIAKEAEQA